MILDNIKNIENYKGLSDNFDKAIDYLTKENLDDLEVGKYEICGDDVFVMIQEYETKSIEDGKYEMHKNFIDIQLILSGEELIGYADVDDLTQTNEYNELKDKQNFKGEGQLHSLTKGMFGVYFVGEGHKPSINNSKFNVKKAVVKIKAV